MSKKCKKTRKTSFSTEERAGRAMMRIWSHDPSANIYDLHVYHCDSCSGFHVGHISYFQKALAKQQVTEGVQNV